MEENKENKGYPLSVANFLPWLEESFAEKYEQSLYGVRARFLCIFSLFRSLLHGFLEISELVKEEPGSSAVKQVSDNAINIIQAAILEYPVCLNFTYCEYFLTTIRDRVDSLTMCLHALCHAESSSPSVNAILDKIHGIAENLLLSLAQLPDYAFALQKRAELAVPLLSTISQKLYMFKYLIEKLVDGLNKMENHKNLKDKDQLIKDFKLGTAHTKIQQVLKHIADVCYILCNSQNSLEYLLDTSKKMAQLIKAKGKKVLNDDLKAEEQTRLANYAAMLTKPNFLNSHMQTINLSELIGVIQQMEQQSLLWHELENGPLVETGVEEIRRLDPNELKDYYNVWKKSISELNSVMDPILYEDEIESKEAIGNLIQELKEYATQIQEFYKAAMFKQYINTFYQKLNSHVFCDPLLTRYRLECFVPGNSVVLSPWSAISLKIND